MFLLHLLTNSRRKRFPTRPNQSRPSIRLRLERLEERLTPFFHGVASTLTNATVQITPNVATLSVTETVTATVMTTVAEEAIPVPLGAGTPTGIVLFNLNNQQQSAALNANGQATVTFTLPLLALFTSQGLKVQYTGAGNYLSGYYSPSTFDAPLYLNFDNVFLPATLSFGQLSFQQQMNTYDLYGLVTVLPSYYTAQGETDNLGWFAFHYIDPGVIDSMTVMGINLPGIFALAAGASV